MKLSRILSFILVLALCISTLTSCFVMTGDDNGNNNNQAPELVPSEGLEYDLINEEAEYAVVGMGVCQDAKVVVPEEHEGKPVTEIADSAFEGNEMIVEVVLPTSILKVGDKAFSGCAQLTSVTMSDTVEIGKDVFRGSINVELQVKHDLVYVPAKAATCEEAGNNAYFYCETCDEYYSDQNGENKLFEVFLPASHSFDGGRCSACGTIENGVKIISVDAVPYLGKFALGTLESAIGLPSEIYVTTADGARHLLAVSWDLSGYNKSVPGSYTIKGYVQAGALLFGEDVSPSIEASIEIVEYMKGTADIVFVLDISGSMSSSIANVKNNLVNFANKVDEAGISARYGIITYSDYTQVTEYDETTKIIKNGASDWFISAAEAKSAINSISLANGGDGPECALDGLLMASTLSTRQDARVFYVLLTDADTKVSNHYGVTSIAQCGQVLAEKDINVTVICGTNLYSHYSPITSATGGKNIDISSSFSTTLSSTLIPIIQSGVEN